MQTIWLSLSRYGLASVLLLAASGAIPQARPDANWQALVRDAPLWESQGVQRNLQTIRRWVLAGEGYCATTDRHILFDRRMRFVGYLSDVGGRSANQNEINAQRKQLATRGKVESWVPGDADRIGYPFVLSCNQPDARLANLLTGYLGKRASARLWGTWDGMQIASPVSPVSLHIAMQQIFQHRQKMGRITLSQDLLALLAGTVIIESGGVREAHSTAGARGIMQLSADVLRDCGVPKRFYLHRMAQIDCALYLFEQNRRNLEPAVLARFTDLPPDKREQLLSLLMVQAYHSGVGRVTGLLNDPALNLPALYFAEHHERFTAPDIALGMVFHNMGREQLGFASLYYFTDVLIAAKAACESVAGLAGCQNLEAMGQTPSAESEPGNDPAP